MGQLLAKFKIWREKNQSWHETTVQGIYLPLSIRLLCEPEQFLQICLSPWRVIIVSDTYVAIQFYNINYRVGTLCRKRRIRLLSLVHRLFEYSLRDHPFGLNFDIAPKKT